jgi:hypothetical protein
MKGDPSDYLFFSFGALQNSDPMRSSLFCLALGALQNSDPILSLFAFFIFSPPFFVEGI